MGKRWLLVSLGFAAIAAPAVIHGATESDGEELELTELSLEELLNIEVTSVSKKAQSLSEAPAAVFVITQDDIRRSGATSIPEVLRMVPGLQVARIDANKWAITSRGFNGRFANKLLVLMDGRSVYTPLFSGVFWDVQDTVLEDIARIEVIRGPGATLWGANAVNGVINIITKSAADTQGGLVSAGAGDEERGFGTLRYGGSFEDGSGNYRIYGKYFERDGSLDTQGDDTRDDWDLGRLGFRADWAASGGEQFTVQGDVYDGESGDELNPAGLAVNPALVASTDEQLSGANLLLHWESAVSEKSDLSLQLYLDRTERDTVIFDEDRNTFDIDFQHRYVWSERHDLLWGLGYRYSGDEVTGRLGLSIDPDSRDRDLFSAFVQDDISLAPDLYRLVLGAKLEHNDYTGLEFQPNLRFLWTPDTRQTFWASIARAVRTPSRADSDTRLTRVIPADDPQNPFPLPLAQAIQGGDDFNSEELIAYEAGYRVRATQSLGFDLALFYNDYDQLRSTADGMPACEPAGVLSNCLPPLATNVVLPITLDNDWEGEAYGVELAVDWRPQDWWRLQAGYTHLDVQVESSNGSSAATAVLEDAGPRNQYSLRSSFDFGKDVEWDLWLRQVDEIPFFQIDSYLTLDTRLAWRARPDLELSLVGQNLLDDRHPEFESELGDLPPAEIERSIYGQVRWRF